MSSMYNVTSSPHLHSKTSTPQIMWEVFVALIPATAVAIYAFGMRSLGVIIWTTGGCIAFEALWQIASKKQVTVYDGSAALTGLLLALNLPPSSPWWLCLAGSFVSIIIAKQIFGGLGQNIFNPALTGRVFLLISFPSYMTRWMIPLQAGELPEKFLGYPVGFIGKGGEILKGAVENFASRVDVVTAASPLGLLKEHGVSAIASVKWWHIFLGHLTNGSLGEISAAALIIGGIFLMLRRIISWHIPVSFLGTMIVIALITNGIDPDRYAPWHFHIFAGGAMIGAIFMATDYVTSPLYPMGKVMFGVGCGVLTMIIRLWGGYPEGVSFAILLMNGLAPLIDRYVKGRKFGFIKTPQSSGA